MNTSSLRYTSLDYAFRENASGNSYGNKAWKRDGTNERVPTSDGRQGMLVEVGDDAIVIRRREFMWGESLGDDWVVPIPARADGPFDFKRRASKRKAPAFAQGACAEARIVDGKDGEKLVEVSYPAAHAVDKCRVFEYEISAIVVDDGIELVAAARRMMAPDFFLPESKCGKAGTCRFRLADLPPKAHIRFEVRPIECFGMKGEPIKAEWLNG